MVFSELIGSSHSFSIKCLPKLQISISCSLKGRWWSMRKWLVHMVTETITQVIFLIGLLYTNAKWSVIFHINSQRLASSFWDFPFVFLRHHLLPFAIDWYQVCLVSWCPALFILQYGHGLCWPPLPVNLYNFILQIPPETFLLSFCN